MKTRLYQILVAVCLVSPEILSVAYCCCCCGCKTNKPVVSYPNPVNPPPPAPAPDQDLPVPSEKDEAWKLRFDVYKDDKGEWRWTLKSRNGRITGDSGEGYKNKQDCIHGVNLIKEYAGKANVQVGSDITPVRPTE